jgi:hypothetical protein
MKTTFVAKAIKRFPLAEHWLALGDSLPPALRTRYGTRFLISLASSHPQEGLAATNLGISRQLRCLVPASQVQARFGKPSLYAGEFGALELAVAFFFSTSGRTSGCSRFTCSRAAPPTCRFASWSPIRTSSG